MSIAGVCFFLSVSVSLNSSFTWFNYRKIIYNSNTVKPRDFKLDLLHWGRVVAVSFLIIKKATWWTLSPLKYQTWFPSTI